MRSLLDRRAFLSLSAASSLSACAGIPVLFLGRESGVIRVDLSQTPELTTPNGATLLRFDGDQSPLIVIHTGSDYRVLSAVCTHQGCTIRHVGRALACPCHASAFDLKGKVTHGPAVRDLPSLNHRVVSGVLEIELTQRGVSL